MKKIFYGCIIAFMAHLCTLQAQDREYPTDPDVSFKNAQELAFNGQYEVARDTLNRILEKFPDYVDVHVLLAKTYSWEKNYAAARSAFNAILSKEKENKEAWMAAIKNEQYAQNLNAAMDLSETALEHFGKDEDIMALYKASETALKDREIAQKSAHNGTLSEGYDQAITLYTAAEVFDEVLDPMYYLALEYKKDLSWGTLLPRANYNRRFGLDGLQAEIDAYPKFNQNYRGYLNLGYSPADIFPRFRAGAEVFRALPKAMEVSLGVRYLAFETDNATAITGTFGLYRGNYYAVLRPFVVPSVKKGVGVSGNLLLRKYLKDAHNYLGLVLAYGFDTELNQFIIDGLLMAETLVYLEAQRLRFEYRFTNKMGNNQYTAHIGVNRQEMAFSSGDLLLSVMAGVAYQVNFGKSNRNETKQ